MHSADALLCPRRKCCACRDFNSSLQKRGALIRNAMRIFWCLSGTFGFAGGQHQRVGVCHQALGEGEVHRRHLLPAVGPWRHDPRVHPPRLYVEAGAPHSVLRASSLHLCVPCISAPMCLLSPSPRALYLRRRVPWWSISSCLISPYPDALPLHLKVPLLSTCLCLGFLCALALRVPWLSVCLGSVCALALRLHVLFLTISCVHAFNLAL